MQHRAMKVIGNLALGLMLSIVVSGWVLADEKTGNLVFNAMKKLQETHQVFLGDARKIKADRKAAVVDRNAVREQYKNAKAGSLDKREFHARFSFAQAKVYRALYDQAKLTHQVAGKHLGILNRLNKSVVLGETRMNAKSAMSVIEAAKPLLESGRSLLISLARSRHKINDPVINSKLSAAYDTAQMYSRYLNQIKNGWANKNTSQLLVRRKLAELIEQFNALYVQTDIFMAMLRDKTIVLKMSNEVAAAESAILALSDGTEILTQLSSDIMTPLMDNLDESDEDLELLIDGNIDGRRDYQPQGDSQRWTNANF